MHLKPLHLFKFTKYSHIAEALTLNDILYWTGDTFISVVLALFVTQFIEGASASTVGISFFIYRLFSALSTVSVGKMFDKQKNPTGKIFSLFLVSIIAGLTYIALSFGTVIWHLFLAMAILGVCRSFDINSWKLMFYSHLESDKKGQTIATYDAAYGISMGAMAAIAGFMGDIYGFRSVIFVAGIIVILGGIPVLSLRGEKAL